MKIIGLTGFAKSGKSTATEVLKEMGGQEIAFAKHLKDVCAVVLGVERSHFDNQDFKEKEFDYPVYLSNRAIEEILYYFEVEPRHFPAALVAHTGKDLHSPRQVAQYVGTEVLRGINKNIHIDISLKLNVGSVAPFLIVSDLRFGNEFDAVSERRGLVIGITRQAATPKNLVNLHDSEKEIPRLISRTNNVIANETTIAEFKFAVRSLAGDYLG